MLEKGAGERSLSRLDERFSVTDRHTFVSANNATLVLSGPDGRQREYVDFMSAYGAVNFGHRNPEIERRLTHGADTVGVCYPAEADRVADWLTARLGRRSGGRVLFQVGGSFAITTAVALAQHARPGRVASIRGGFHGLGADTLAMTSVQRSIALQETPLTRHLSGLTVTIEPGDLPASWDGVSCLVYEPVQGANGYIPLDPAWLRQLEFEARSAGVTTIADEVQSGFFRHGVFSPALAADLTPDILVYSKSLTNGIFPLSAVVYDERLEPPRQGSFLAHTFQTATLGYYAADAVTHYVDTAPLAELAASVQRVLEELAAGLDDGVADVHVTGPSLSFRPTGVMARELARRALDRGVIIFVGGGDFERIRIAPPLTIPHDQLRSGAEVLADILRHVQLSIDPHHHQSPAFRSRSMERHEFYENLKVFVHASAESRSSDLAAIEIGEDDNLFDLGLVNSFSMMKMLMHVEELLSVQVDVTEHEPETFFTLRGMYDSLATIGSSR